jgi:hypothetical protein
MPPWPRESPVGTPTGLSVRPLSRVPTEGLAIWGNLLPNRPIVG